MAHLEPFPVVERLSEKHNLAGFDCGRPSLNDWLERYALVNNKSDAARTYVALRDTSVAGYYSLAAGSLVHEAAPHRIAKGLARHPIPVVILARLAVDRSAQGSGLGAALLQDALLRTKEVAKVIGIRAVLVHALDEKAREFYLRFDFQPNPSDEMQLMLLMKDIRANFSR